MSPAVRARFKFPLSSGALESTTRQLALRVRVIDTKSSSRTLVRVPHSDVIRKPRYADVYGPYMYGDTIIAGKLARVRVLPS